MPTLSTLILIRVPQIPCTINEIERLLFTNNDLLVTFSSSVTSFTINKILDDPHKLLTTSQLSAGSPTLPLTLTCLSDTRGHVPPLVPSLSDREVSASQYSLNCKYHLHLPTKAGEYPNYVVYHRFINSCHGYSFGLPYQ